MTRFTRLAWLAGCLLVAATLLFAQFETAEVLGMVRDASGGAITGANVTLTNQDTGIQGSNEEIVPLPGIDEGKASISR